MKRIILFFFISCTSFVIAGNDYGCKTEYVDKKLKVEKCKSTRGFDGTEHSVLFFTNLTQGALRVKFRCKVWYNCSNYNQSGFLSSVAKEEWTETIYLKPEEEYRYIPTKDYFKTCTCPTYIQEFELIEYAAKAMENKEVDW